VVLAGFYCLHKISPVIRVNKGIAFGDDRRPLKMTILSESEEHQTSENPHKMKVS
ncbi:hypothetical protein CEXT_207071, partial [Caerostris extrusa]